MYFSAASTHFRPSNVVAHRFLDVDVLAGLAGPDRHQRVPVVATGNRDRVEILVFEGLTDILHAVGVLPPICRIFWARLVQRRVGVDQISDLHSRHSGKLAHVDLAAAVDARHAMHGVVGSEDRAEDLVPAIVKIAPPPPWPRRLRNCVVKGWTWKAP